MRFIRHFIATLLLLSFGFFSYSQERTKSTNKYTIITNDSEFGNEYFIGALNRANLESFRLKDKDVLIEFKEGAQCLIKAANSIEELILDKTHDYKDSYRSGFTLPIFSVATNGYILTEYKKKRK